MKTAETAAPKQPMGKRELLAWVLITVFVSVTVGLIAGWFIRSNVIAERDQAVAAVSKDQGR